MVLDNESRFSPEVQLEIDWFVAKITQIAWIQAWANESLQYILSAFDSAWKFLSQPLRDSEARDAILRFKNAMDDETFNG